MRCSGRSSRLVEGARGHWVCKRKGVVRGSLSPRHHPQPFGAPDCRGRLFVVSMIARGLRLLSNGICAHIVGSKAVRMKIESCRSSFSFMPNCPCLTQPPH
jgi:hypothetical protein